MGHPCLQRRVPGPPGLTGCDCGLPSPLASAVQKKFYEHSDVNAQFVKYFDLDQLVEWDFDYVISKIGLVPARDVGLCL